MEKKEMTREMEAYIVLLHLVSQGYASFADIMHLLGWKRYYQAVAQRIVDHINRKLPALSKEWGEDIPQINAFVFITGSGKCSDYICKYVLVMRRRERSRQHVKSRSTRKKLRLTQTGIKS